MKAGVTELLEKKEYKERRKELELLNKHSITRSYQLEFYTCRENYCEHCRKQPIRSQALFTSLQETGGRLVTPTKSQIHNGHYKTALEHYAILGSNKNMLGIDEGMTSFTNGAAKHLKCKHGCVVVFHSKAACTRHENLLHLEKKHKNVVEKEFVYKMCDFKATSYYYLRKHKKEEGHVKGN